MNEKRQFPTPNECESPPSQLEQSLKQYRPQPVSLRAADVFRAASEAARSSLPGEFSEQAAPARRAAPWKTIGLSWACGAIVGGLLVFVALGPTETTPRPWDGPDLLKESSMTNAVKTDSGEVDATVARRDEPATEASPAPRDVRTLWTEAELRGFSVVWREIDLAFGAAPLRAGSLVRPDAHPPESGFVETSIKTAWKWSDSPDSHVAIHGSSPPTPTSQRNQLIRELLGEPL